MGQVIDIHCQCKVGALFMLDINLKNIQSNLRSGNIEPNYAPFHYIKVITGTGVHTVGGRKYAVLKDAVREYLEDEEY